MPKILSFNVPLETNLSYAHTHNRLIDNMQGYKWFYGPYHYNGPISDKGRYVAVNGELDQINMPKHIGRTISEVKPDILFMHEDMQRVLWMDRVKSIPTVLWIPWDNEDNSLRQAYQICKKVDVPVTVAKFAQKMLADAGIDAMQIYNPVDTHIYKPDPKAGKEFKEELGLPKDAKIITWVGRPGWRKRFFHIIDIFDRLQKLDPNIYLLLHSDLNDPALGYNPQELLWGRNMLQDDKIIFPSGMRFDKGVSADVLSKIYNATDVYIAPHGGEGMCLPIVEAMACGKPFVATDYSTTQEFANYKTRGGEMIGTRGIGAKIGNMIKDKGVMRPFVDIDDFVKKTLFLLKNPEIGIEMGKEGRKFALKECSSQSVAARWKLLFDDMTSCNLMGFK